MKNSIRNELIGTLILVAAMWVVHVANFVIFKDLTDWGIVPRTLWGLVGIPLAPFLHTGFGHLIGNTIPLVILMVLMAGSRTDTISTVAEIALLGGVLLWLFGRNGSPESPIIHAGASGLIYGMIAFLIVAGFRERRFLSLAVALVVAVLYGTTLVFGVLPSMQSNVSWDGHLTGAIAGAALAFFTLGHTNDQAEASAAEKPLA